MDVLSFRDYCLSLPLTEETTPFDETTLVYKIGGKMYACADMGESPYPDTEVIVTDSTGKTVTCASGMRR